jgi:hypothetical protein
MSVLDYRSAIEERATPPRGSIGNRLGWAIFLGMSWTWCIGMFLPVLLIRDFGAWAWWVFAIPNVIGAAAMGWTIDRDTSIKMVQRHRVAIRFFSLVTAAFQIFFAVWMFNVLRAPGGSAWIMLALAAIVFYIGRGRVGVNILLAVVVLALSLGCISHFNRLPEAVASDAFPRALLALAPVCVFGFALCPYLDGTFHLARQNVKPEASRAAFGIGFGVFFLGMIYFTLVYAYPVLHWMVENPFARRVLVTIGFYWTFQLAFTVGLHWQTIGWKGALVSALVGIALGFGSRLVHYRGVESGELIYRLFMAFYGLVFPAYVWLCMLPSWREPTEPGGRALRIFALAVALAAPFYWVGFIENGMIWLLTGLGIVLLARLAVPPARGRT